MFLLRDVTKSDDAARKDKLGLTIEKIPKSPCSSWMKGEGNGQASRGNLRETEKSISPLGNNRKWARFPKVSQAKNVVKFRHSLQW